MPPKDGPPDLKAAEKEADRQLTRLSILTTISQALSENLELDPLLCTVHREVGRLFDTTNFLIALHKPGSTEWSLVYRIEHGVRSALKRHPLGIGLMGYTIRSGEPLFLPDFQAVRLRLEADGIFVYGEAPTSWMCVPLHVAGQVVGAMAVQNYAFKAAYNLNDLELFMAIASQIALAIRNAQLYESAERRAREMEALVNTGQNISSSLDLGTVLDRAATEALALLTGDAFAIFMKQADGSFAGVAAAGAEAEAILAARLQPGRGILAAVAANGKAEIVNDSFRDPRVQQLPGTLPNQDGEKLMAAPLKLDGGVIGLVVVWRLPGHEPFDEADLRFLEGIGRQVTVAIANARLFGEAKAAQAEAETANKAKSAFLASMSHELRTPLNAIILYSDLLRDEVVERGVGDLTGDLGKIQKAGRHLLGLIDDVLDLSKIEAGRMSILLEDCFLPELIAEVVSTAQPLFSHNGNAFVEDLDPSLQGILTDARKFRQIIYNLLSNAAKFTKAGTITLATRRSQEDGGVLLLSVADTGIGMDAVQMERVFQEFTQAEESISRTYGGTGLGLTLCRKFAGLLGGSIHVESSLGQGAVFSLRLPGLTQA